MQVGISGVVTGAEELVADGRRKQNLTEPEELVIDPWTGCMQKQQRHAYCFQGIALVHRNIKTF